MNITIDWIRHGESCGNIMQGHILDKPSNDRKVGYDKLTIIRKSNSDSILSDVWNKTMNLGGIIKNMLYYEPNLSYIGICHSINLGRYFMNNNKHDIYISSGMTRTIMTALLSLRHNPDAVIYVVPYINEFSNISSITGIDYQNTAVPSNILKKRIRFIKDWLEKNWITNFDDIEIMTDLTELFNNPNLINHKYKLEFDSIIKLKKDKEKYNIEDFIIRIIKDKDLHEDFNLFIDKYSKIFSDLRRFKRCPSVDFSIYEYFENKYNNTQKPDLEMFYKEVIPILKEKVGDKSDLKIAAYSHGLVIRQIWKNINPEYYKINHQQMYEMMNTQVSTEKQIINGNNISKEIRFSFYPMKIRENFEDFECLNNNLCDNKSILGINNFNLGYYEPLTIDEVSPDVKFVYENGYDLHKEEDTSNFLVGGNKNNYLKYKERYLKLKKMM